MKLDRMKQGWNDQHSTAEKAGFITGIGCVVAILLIFIGVPIVMLAIFALSLKP